MLNVPVSDYLLVIAHSAHITRPAYQHCAEAGSWSRSGSPWERRIRSGSPCETHLVRGGEQEEQLVADHTVSSLVSGHTRHDEVPPEPEQRLLQRDQARAPEWRGGSR